MHLLDTDRFTRADTRSTMYTIELQMSGHGIHSCRYRGLDIDIVYTLSDVIFATGVGRYCFERRFSLCCEQSNPKTYGRIFLVTFVEYIEGNGYG